MYVKVALVSGVRRGILFCHLSGRVGKMSGEETGGGS